MVYCIYRMGVCFMEKYTVTGMTCAACQARVEKAVKAVGGVESCSVSLLTNTLGVEGSADEKDIIKAVTAAGYGAKKQGGAADASPQDDYSALLEDRETPVLKRRLILSAGFLLLLMYISMGHGMLGLYLPAALSNPAAVGVCELMLASAVMLFNRRFFVSGSKALFKRSPNMDTLVSLGSSAAYIYSLVLLFVIFDRLSKGDTGAADIVMSLYFETAAMIPTLITVGKLLEAISKGKTTDALKGLMRLSPQTASVVKDGKEQTVDISQVRVGDIVAVRPGERVPVDAVIVSGSTAIDESALTGESVPADKAEGDEIYAASVNCSGFITARAERVGKDTALSKIIALVSDASATKAPIARIADKVSAVFVPAVIGIALLTFVVWLAVGREYSYALSRAIAVLVISCPCALGLATPVAIMVGSGVGAKNAILFKTAESLEAAGRINVCALDKTGTITEGRPQVTDVIPLDGCDEEKLLGIAFSLESLSDHPLAKAVSSCCEERGALKTALSDFSERPGKGVTAIANGARVFGGSVKYITEAVGADDNTANLCRQLSQQGKTPMLFASDKEILGIIAVSDTIKPDAVSTVNELAGMGIDVIMITGDNELTAQAVAKQAGIDHVIAGVLPDGKDSRIKALRSEGITAMVGDGINDAPALTSADVGIAVGAGADIAVDAADIVLMRSELKDVAAAVRLSRAVVRNIHQNLFWAFFYNIICIPLAAGFYSALFGLGFEMSPMVGAAAMSLSSFTVCMNALRIDRVDIHDPGRDKKLSNRPGNDKKECMTMEKTMTIEGMMCPHCEAAVKKALEALDGVEDAQVSHEKGTAVVSLSAEVSDEVLTKAVEDKDYTVKGIA